MTVGVITTWGTIIKSCSISKVKSHWSKINVYTYLVQHFILKSLNKKILKCRQSINILSYYNKNRIIKFLKSFRTLIFQYRRLIQWNTLQPLEMLLSESPEVVSRRISREREGLIEVFKHEFTFNDFNYLTKVSTTFKEAWKL